MVIIIHYPDNIVCWSIFLTHESLYIPIKYPAFLVSLPLKIPILLLCNLCYSYLNMECNIWYTPEPKILHISLWDLIIFCTMVFWGNNLIIKTHCDQLYAWISTLHRAISVVCFQVGPFNIYQTSPYLIMSFHGQLFYYATKSITYYCSVFVTTFI